MAVRQLAGPFALVSEKNVPVQYQVGAYHWYPDVGLTAVIDGQFRCFLSLDGVYQPISRSRPYANAWYVAHRRMIGTKDIFDTTEIEIEPRALAEVSESASFYTGLFVHNYIRMQDRRLYFDQQRIVSVIDGALAVEGDIFPFGSGEVAPGRSDFDILVFEFTFNGSDTRFCFYDTRLKVIASQIFHLGMACNTLVYAPEYGIIVSLHGDSLTGFEQRIWSLENEPVEVTEPELVAGQSQGGRLATYRTQVLGANADPCPGELVDWTLSGAGRLLSLQSKADRDGYATVRVLYGLDETGDSTVKASVRC